MKSLIIEYELKYNRSTVKIKHFFVKNNSIIFFLGISAALPLALILSTLKAILLEKGFSIETIGFMSLVSLPYSLKIFFAPFIDSLSIPFLTKRLGQRRSWMILTQMFLMILIVALGIAIIGVNLFWIVLLSFTIAFASASQDIVIDAYRIELFEPKDQALAAGFYIYGYRIGLLISGALALLMADRINWDAVCFFLAATMLFGIVAVYFADDTRKNWSARSHDFISWFKNYVIEPFRDFMHKPKWLVILLFIICFKLSDVFAGNLTVPFLLMIDFTKTEIATIVKTFGLMATLFGIFCGGILVKKFDIYKSLWIAAFAQMLSNLAFAYLAQIGHDTQALYLVIFTENFSGGIGDAVFVAYLSALCNVAFSATQYATLVSFATIGRSLFSSSAGIAATFFGWKIFFVFSAFLAIPSLIFLWILRKN